MKKLFILLLALCMLSGLANAQQAETLIALSDGAITVNGEAITTNPSAPVYLELVNETHEDVPAELKDVENRVVTIAAAGVYRVSGTANDAQIAVKAGEADDVRLILDGVNITCRTAPGIAAYSARDPRIPGEYGFVIELAEGSENFITGSHTESDDDPEFDGAIGAQISLGFEGSGSLTVDADNEGVEVAYGHLTINGGVFHISANDDPLNVAEDNFGVLTMNDGYVYSSVKPLAGGEGDGIDSNGYIVFNGGTAINLAHPSSMDGGIDSDLGSSINGGIIVGAGNMYDPIEATSNQLFMMLEFGESTDQLIVVTDENDVPVFAYDFPYDYMYIAFSTPALEEGKAYRVYLGGNIEGEATDGLYTSITAYTPGVRMQHGEGNAQQRGFGFGMPGDMPEGMDFGGMPGGFDPANMPEDMPKDMPNDMPNGMNFGGMPQGGFGGGPSGFDPANMPEDMPKDMNFGGMPNDANFGGMPQPPQGGFGGGMRPFGMESSSDVATFDFVLTHENTGFTNVRAAQ